MIYDIKLPQLTEQRLTDIVLLQMDLLYYAATHTQINAETCLCYFDDEKILHYGFKGRGHAIANWLWEPHTSVRHKLLQDFSSSCHQACYGEKEQEANAIILAWCQQLNNEVKALLDITCPLIEVKNFFGDKNEPELSEEKAPQWKKDAKKFFLHFYQNYLGKSGPTFPATLFTGDNPEAYGRQEFLREFLGWNKELEICPFCDESRFYTQNMLHIHSNIDHYLPKDDYPHFACHPYNLVLTCHACNSSTKGTKDPLRLNNNPRQTLSRRAFPYSASGLSINTYLKINLGERATPINILDLAARSDLTDIAQQELEEVLFPLLKTLYKIPARWSNASQSSQYEAIKQANRISETLFRRMRQFLGDGKGMPLGCDMPQEVYNTLKQLLYYIHHDDSQRDPFAFAMVWILATLLNEEVKPALGQRVLAPSAQPAFIKEIMSWFGQSLSENETRNEQAERLLKTLQE